jgi:DNA-binding YbaB/EbfC family protein
MVKERFVVFDKLGNFADVLRNAGKIRDALEKATESLGQVQVEASAGGGAVTARANGRLEILSVKIDPKLLADGDTELLEDLVVLAVNQALTKAREAATQSIQSAAGNLPMPPGIGNLFGA